MKATSLPFNGAEVVLSAHLVDDVATSLAEVTVLVKQGSASEIRTELLHGLERKGWSGEVSVSTISEITITSVKHRVGLCLQLGNMARMYADLLKLQSMYASDKIMAGMMVVPSATAAHALGSNIVNAPRLHRELSVFSRVITLPLTVVAFE